MILYFTQRRTTFYILGISDVILNQFFDNRLNRLSKNQFLYDISIERSYESILNISPKLNVICHFSTIQYFNQINFLRHLAPLHGGDRHMSSHTFLYEIQFQTTFIWSFLDITFWQHWVCSKSTFICVFLQFSSRISRQSPVPFFKMAWNFSKKQKNI